MKSRPGLALSGDLLGHSTSQSGFHPSELFGASDAGGLYDPSDLSSMGSRLTGGSLVGQGFPVSAGETVGQIIDKSQLGDVSVEGYFQGGTNLMEDWATVGNWTDASDRAIITYENGEIVIEEENTGEPKVHFSYTAVANSFYLVEFTYRTDASNPWYYTWNSTGELLNGDTNGGLMQSNSDVTVRYLVKHTDTAAYWEYSGSTNTPGQKVYLKNFRVVEIPGNHLTAPSDAARPVLRDEIVDGTDVDVSGETELVTNGAFSTNDLTGFTLSGTASADASSGAADITVASNFDGIYQNISVPVNSWVKSTLTISNYTSGTVEYVSKEAANNVGAQTGVHPNGITANGSYTALANLTTAGIGSIIIRNRDAGGDFTVDDISMKIVPASRARRWYLDFDGTNDALHGFVGTTESFTPTATMAVGHNGNDQDVTMGTFQSGTDRLYIGYPGGTAEGAGWDDLPFGTIQETGRDDDNTTVALLAGDSTFVNLRLDGRHSGNFTSAAAPTLAGADESIALGGFATSATGISNPLLGRVYSAFLVDKLLTREQASDLEGWIAEKSGAAVDERKFGIEDIFDTNTTGAWYDPSDLSSMSTEIITATADTFHEVNPYASIDERVSVGDTVGTIFDKSQIGGQSMSEYIDSATNLVTNGTFDTDISGWSDAGGTVGSWETGGYMRIESAGFYAGMYQDISGSGENWYAMRLRCRSFGDRMLFNTYDGTGDFTDRRVITSTNSNDDADTGWLEFEYIWRATDGTRIYLQVDNTPTGYTLVDDVRVVTLPGNHLVAPSDDARPVLYDTIIPAASDIDVSTQTELVTNGTFDTDTDWTKLPNGTGTVEITGGSITITYDDTTNRGKAAQSFTTEAGKWYKFSADATGTGGVRIDIGTSSENSNIALSLTNEFVFRAVGTTTWVTLYHSGSGSGITVIYDNVSIKEVPPISRRYYLDFDGTDDTLIGSFTASSDPVFMSVGMSEHSAGNYGPSIYAAAAGLTNRHMLYESAGNTLALFEDNDVITANIPVAQNGNVNVHQSFGETNNFWHYRNGTLIGTDTSGNLWVTQDWDTVALASNISGSNFSDINVYGFVLVNREPTDDERAVVLADLTKKSGA